MKVFKIDKANNKILMLVYSYFPSDVRVRREANALFTNGYQVDVLCLKHKGEFAFEVYEGINIVRINLKKRRSSFFNYFYDYSIFFLKSFFEINALYIKNRYKVIHVHNMPNFIVFIAVIPKLFGAKVILDLHDPLPEVLISITNKTKDSLLYKIMVFEEKLSTWFADQLITTNIAFFELFVSRGCNKKKLSIVMNSPQTSIFNKSLIQKTEFEFISKKFRVMYNGSIIERYGLDILIDAINKLKDKIPEIELNIFGEGEFLPNILEKVELLNLGDYVKYRGFVPIDKIVEEIPRMDLGIVPNRLNEFTKLNFPVRIFEMIHFKKPVIVPKTRGISDYFNENSIFYFKPEDVKNLTEVVLNVYKNPDSTNQIISNGYKVYQNYIWEIQSKNLLQVYNRLIN